MRRCWLYLFTVCCCLCVFAVAAAAARCCWRCSLFWYDLSYHLRLCVPTRQTLAQHMSVLKDSHSSNMSRKRFILFWKCVYMHRRQHRRVSVHKRIRTHIRNQHSCDASIWRLNKCSNEIDLFCFWQKRLVIAATRTHHTQSEFEFVHRFFQFLREQIEF